MVDEFQDTNNINNSGCV
ncbi:hypothetical protein OH492_01435 [Vibrio chagasii]|nr:hypothetical protein [Vibrio chagasii]